MHKFAVVSDSACDLPVQTVQKHNIDIVPFTISFDKINRLTDGVDITNEEFYNRLESNDSMPKTYFPSVGEYVARFKNHLEQGQDILCLCLSSKLSKSYFSALNAKKILSHTFPDNKIMVMDSENASAGQGLLVLNAVKLCETDVEAAYAKLEELRKTAKVIFTLTSLRQLVRGGRLSATVMFFGKLLGINPIISLENGAMRVIGKTLGRKKALEFIKKYAVNEMNGKPEEYDLVIMHARALGEASAVAAEFSAEYGVTPAMPPVDVGVTIGMHTGTTVVAVAFVKKA